MYRVWFNDLVKAIAAFRQTVNADLFGSIEGNACGDFIFKIDEDKRYIVKHTDFSVWEFKGDWRTGGWEKISQGA